MFLLVTKWMQLTILMLIVLFGIYLKEYDCLYGKIMYISKLIYDLPHLNVSYLIGIYVAHNFQLY